MKQKTIHFTPAMKQNSIKYTSAMEHSAIFTKNDYDVTCKRKIIIGRSL